MELVSSPTLWRWLDGEGDEEDLEEIVDVDDLGLDEEEDQPVVVIGTRIDDEEIDTEWSDSLEDRDQRISEYDGDADHGTVRELLRETGLLANIQDAMEGLGVEEEDVTTEEGDLLDMRNIIRRLAGDTTVDDYYRRRIQRPADDIAIGVSLDMSGSMAGDELDAKAAVGGFLFSVQNLGGEVVANGWKDRGRSARVQIITGPYETFAWHHLDSVEPGGGTPTGVGIWECGLMLQRLRSETKLLCVITDGNPTSMGRDGDYDGSVDEAAATVSDLQEYGIEVVGFGFGMVNEETLAEIFGEENARYVDLEELPETLVEVFADRCGPEITIPQ